MSNHWQSFWESYRNVEARSEDDLFIQVGKTIARQPIAREIFKQMIERIITRLELDQQDHLLDLCCGNGLISFELARRVERVTGVDFAEHLINAAMDFKSLPNIAYHTADVTSPIVELIGCTAGKNAAKLPNKYLMNDALAYFTPQTLARILDNINAARTGTSFRFLITGIPNHDLKWNFYDTPERKRHHLETMRAGDNANDGLGRWWQPAEVEAVCAKKNLKIHIENQPDAISNYRMDALIWQDA